MLVNPPDISTIYNIYLSLLFIVIAIKTNIFIFILIFTYIYIIFILLMKNTKKSTSKASKKENSVPSLEQKKNNLKGLLL